MSDQPPNDGGGGAQPAPEQPSMPVLDVYNFACQFMAQNGWYMLFAFVIFCLIKKNVDAYLLVSLFFLQLNFNQKQFRNCKIGGK